MNTTRPVAAPTGSGPRSLYVVARDRLARFPMAVLLLGVRIGVGSVFFKAGLLKYSSFEFAVRLFEEEYKVPVLSPVLAARVTMFNELTWPVLLFLGFATRVATLPLLGMITVIQAFVYPQAWTDHLFWASALLLVLTRGAGALSVDHLIERALEKRRG